MYSCSLQVCLQLLDMKLSVRRVSAQQSTKPADGGRRKNSEWRQFMVTIVVNIATFVAGTMYGWAAPLLPVLQSEESPVGIPPITDDDASWLASIYCLSRLVTIPLFMYSIDHFGCKITGYLVAVSFLVSYTMLLFADSMQMLFWGRFICGIAAGGTGILAPSYTIDIAEDNNKGKLNMIFAQSMNLGLTFAFAMIHYTSYVVFHASCIVMTITFVLALFWLPESPLFLMTAGKVEEAKEVLKWMRNDKESDFELERMKIRAEEILEKRKRKVSFSNLTDRRMLRALFIVLGLTLNQQLSGMGPIEAYAVTIFQQAGSVIPPNITTMLLCVPLIIGTHFSSMAIEKYGRRFLLVVSDVVITLCLLAVGSYFYLQRLGWNVESVGWLPIASLLLYILSSGLGIGVLPFTIATELVHPNYRSFVQTANVAMLSVSTFVPTLTYVPLVTLAGQHGCFWLYAACCAVGTVCIFLTVPETKNRSLEDVLDQMASDNFIHSVLHYKEEPKNYARNVSAAKTVVMPVTETVTESV